MKLLYLGSPVYSRSGRQYKLIIYAKRTPTDGDPKTVPIQFQFVKEYILREVYLLKFDIVIICFTIVISASCPCVAWTTCLIQKKIGKGKRVTPPYFRFESMRYRALLNIMHA